METRRIIFLFIIILVSIFIVSCAINPVTGKSELMLYSEQDEVAMGKKVDMSVKSQYGVYHNPRLTAYITRIGQKLAPYTHRPKLRYHFAVLDSPVVNAFAAPGGYIYVTRGILSMINSEAELAVILGHEMGHVNARHSVRKLTNMLLINLGLAIGSALDEDIAKIAGIANIGIQLLFLKFSRKDEFQADSLGIVYARRAGYPPGEMIRFFNSLQTMGDLSGRSSLPGFLSTHPLTKNRIKKVRESLSKNDYSLAKKKRDYLNAVNGMIYGENPRQGFFRGNNFYHPDLRFTFKYPQGWKTSNTPKQVVISPQKGSATIVLQAETTQENLLTYLNKKASSLNPVQSTLQSRNQYISGLNNKSAVCDVNTDKQKNLKVYLTCIRKGGLIFTFFALCQNRDFNNFYPSFNKTILSFAPLRDPRYLNLKSKRLRVIRGNGRKSLKSFFQGASMNSKKWNYFALLNGVGINFIPPSGSLIKVIK